jgi:hypothetical protein
LLAGVLLNIVFPAYLITIFLAVLLGVTTAITLRKVEYLLFLFVLLT